MKINKLIKNSVSLRVFNWLFVDGCNNIFENSKIVKVFSKIDNAKLSIIFLVISFISLWYESLFTKLGIGFVEGLNFGFIFLLLSVIFCDKSRLRSTKSIIYILLFVLVLFISGLWAAINGLEIGMILTGIMLFCQFGLAFVAASTIKNKMMFINILLLLSLPLIVIGIFQGIWGEATSKLWVSGSENLIDARAFGFFGSPNVMGSLVMITAIMSAFSFMDKKKWYYAVYFFLSTIAIILTFSRSAWLGLFAGIIVALLIKNWQFIFAAPISLLALLIPSVRQRLLVSFSQEYLIDAALDGRTWSFNNALEIFKSSPILGTGPGSYGGQTAIYYNSPIYLRGMQNGYIALPYTDNQWMQILVQTGLIGIFTVVGFFISHFIYNLKQFKKSGQYFSLGIIAGLIAIIVNGIFGNIWEFGAISVLSGAYLGLGNNYEK